MICKYVELTMESKAPRDVAKTMLKFWLYQAEKARQDYTACLHKINACRTANERARVEWRNSDDGVGFGDPRLPFTTTEIDREKHRLPILKQNLDEVKAMADYMVNYITDRAHPEETDETENSANA